VFVPNTDEAQLILGVSDPVHQARMFHELGARRVIITCGELGVVSFSDSLRVKISAYEVPFVDASGGGDAFNAGYVLGLLEDRSELDCLKLASAVGASCVREVGTTAGVFTRDEADEFTRQHELTIEPIR
jgi:sugar/nucleoside kinase (ribokinase family)